MVRTLVSASIVVTASVVCGFGFVLILAMRAPESIVSF